MSFDLLISSVSKHISLTAEELEFFTSLLKSKFLANGEFLLREGDVCKYESFVVRGCLKTYYLDENGLEHIIDLSIDILQISKTDLELLYQRIPMFERFFRILFQNAYIAQRDQINLALSASAEERYLLFVKKKQYAEKRFSQKDIASYLGITPQFLSTLKKRLSQLM